MLCLNCRINSARILKIAYQVRYGIKIVDRSVIKCKLFLILYFKQNS